MHCVLIRDGYSATSFMLPSHVVWWPEAVFFLSWSRVRPCARGIPVGRYLEKSFGRIFTKKLLKIIFIITLLAYNKPKYGVCNRIINLYNNLIQKCLEFVLEDCAPRIHGQQRLGDDDTMHWLIAASTIAWSNCAHSLIRRVFEFIDVSYIETVNFLPQNTPNAVFC